MTSENNFYGLLQRRSPDEAVVADLHRNWLERREFGALHKSHSLQSDLCITSFHNNDGAHSLELESLNLELIKSISLQVPPSKAPTPGMQKPYDKVSADLKKQSMEYMQYLPLSSCPTFSHHSINSVSDGLSLAHELCTTVVGAAMDDRSGPQSTSLIKSQAPPPTQHTTTTTTSSSSSSSSSHPPVTRNVPPAEKKKSGFLSAKDQFKDEGGDVQALKRGKSSSSSSTSNANTASSSSSSSCSSNDWKSQYPSLSIYEPALVEKIFNDMATDQLKKVAFDDISGLTKEKVLVKEIICYPMKRPDLFQGLRSFPRALLLFGPPGTGKTLIAKAVANEAGATFFSISSSSLTSKWVGEGEKGVRTLFAVALAVAPSVVFIDEVDSLLTARSGDESESSRRMKTEFLVQLDGTSTSVDSERLLVIMAATNRPDELDDAARRRFVKRIYIPLPDFKGRVEQFNHLLSKESNHELSAKEIQTLAEKTDGFSGADISTLCSEAAMVALREALAPSSIDHVEVTDICPICMRHFLTALNAVTPSVNSKDLQYYIDWNIKYGVVSVDRGTTNTA